MARSASDDSVSRVEGTIGSVISLLAVALILGLSSIGCSAIGGDAGQVAVDASTSTAPSTVAEAGVGGAPVAGADETVAADGATRATALSVVADAEVVTAFEEPDVDSGVVAAFQRDPTYPQYFLAVPTFAEYEGQGDGEWLEVLLPVRPNGTTGWVRVDDVVLYQNRFRLEIDVSDRLLTLREGSEVVFTTEVAVGTGATPTPIGSFFTTVLYQVPDPDGPYGPYAFALSGFSEVLTSFNGGDGLVGIHGTNDPASLGTEVSHGCIRIPNDLITRMAEMVPLGTPVTIAA